MMRKSRINIVRVPLKQKSKDYPAHFPPMPILYLELLENKEKIKPELRNQDYTPPEITEDQKNQMIQFENDSLNNSPSADISSSSKSNQPVDAMESDPIYQQFMAEMRQSDSETREKFDIEIGRIQPKESESKLKSRYKIHEKYKDIDLDFNERNDRKSDGYDSDYDRMEQKIQNRYSRQQNKYEMKRPSSKVMFDDDEKEYDSDNSSRRYKDTGKKYDQIKSKPRYKEKRYTDDSDDEKTVSKRGYDSDSDGEIFSSSHKKYKANIAESPSRNKVMSIFNGTFEDEDSNSKHKPKLAKLEDIKFTNAESSSQTQNSTQPKPTYSQFPPRLSEIEQGNGVKANPMQFAKIQRPDEDEINKKRELLFRFDILRKSYKNHPIPEFSEYTDLITLQKSYDDTVRRLSLDSSVENYKKYLIGGFMVVEYVFGMWFKFDMKGFTQQQMVSMNGYERLLIELGEKSYVAGEGSSWPVEARLLSMIVINAVVFIISKMVFAKTGANLLGMMNSVSNMGFGGGGGSAGGGFGNAFGGGDSGGGGNPFAAFGFGNSNTTTNNNTNTTTNNAKQETAAPPKKRMKGPSVDLNEFVADDDKKKNE